MPGPYLTEVRTLTIIPKGLRRNREALGLSKVHMSALTGILLYVYNNIEDGRTLATHEEALAIEKALDDYIRGLEK